MNTRFLCCAAAAFAIAIRPDVGASQPRQAGASEQRALEVVAATELAAHFNEGQKQALRGWAIEPLLLVAKPPVIESNQLTTIADSLHPRLSPAPAHDSAQLAKLSTILGVPAIVDTSHVCSVASVDRCRLGAAEGMVTFASAWIDGQTARMMVSFHAKADVRLPDATTLQRLGGTTWIIDFRAVDDGSWRVSSSRRIVF